VAPDDRELVRRCLRGDQDACADLVERHARLAGTVIWRAVGSIEGVEDLVQETFLRVFRGLPRFDSRAKLSTWIYTIAHRVAADHLRQQRRQPQERPDDGEELLQNALSTGPSPEMLASATQLTDLVRTHVAGLPDKYRLPLVYAAIDGLDYATIGQMLDLPVGTVKTFVHRGKQMLRERIEAACSLKTT
jgi:RNA polymerase sigma-70 factor (ECF subfamily)